MSDKKLIPSTIVSGCRKPNKKPRKRREKPVVVSKEELKSKLHQKLKEKRLERTSAEVRENRMDMLEERLEEATTTEEKIRIKEEIVLLENVEEKLNRYTGDFPDYVDPASYGGSLEHPD